MWRISVPRTGSSKTVHLELPGSYLTIWSLVHVVVLVHHQVIGLHRDRIRQRHDRRPERLGVDPGEAAAPGVADPEHVGILVRAHAPRPLLPREWAVEGEILELVVERARFRRDAVELRLHR